MKSNKLLKGSLQMIILRLLSENEQMYGYEITQKVRILTEGKLLITEGALYPSLHKLEAEGLLENKKEMVGNRMRKYYKLTNKGKRASNEKRKSFFEFVGLMELILGKDKSHTS